MADKHIPFVSSETGKADVFLLAKDINGNGLDYGLAQAGLPSSTGQKTAANSMPVVSATADTLLDGNITATTSAAALTAGASHKQTVQNDPSNTTDIYVGNATTQSTRLIPGAAMDLTVSNLNLIYVKTVSGTARVNYSAEV
jgi:hypothetical protein